MLTSPPLPLISMCSLFSWADYRMKAAGAGEGHAAGDRPCRPHVELTAGHTSLPGSP